MVRFAAWGSIKWGESKANRLDLRLSPEIGAAYEENFL